MEAKAVNNVGNALLTQILMAQAGSLATNVIQCEITPDDAKQLLTMNIESNRCKKTHEIIRIANEIKNGTLKFCPDPICINVEGKLVNGQNRLNAIIKADKPATFFIMVNVPKDAVIDRGVTRSTADSLRMSERVPKDLAKSAITSVARCYLTIKCQKHVGAITDEEIAQFIDEYGDMIQFCVTVSARGAHNGIICKKAPVQAAMLGALICGVDEKTVEEFARIANSGYPEDSSQGAAMFFRNYVQKNMHNYGGFRIGHFLCAFTEMCIKDFAQGTPRRAMYKTVKHVYIGNKEEKPLVKG